MPGPSETIEGGFALPRIATRGDGRHGSRIPSVCRNLDLALFQPGKWFAIDTDNRAVPGVAAPDLGTALTLVGRGRVAAIVGRLRPGFVAVDIDVDDMVGDAVTEQIAAWCVSAGVWHLVRPSGGAPGRHHVIVAAGAALDELVAAVDELRHRWNLRGKQVDVRTSLRPLTSPHRHGGNPRPYGNLTAAFQAMPDTAKAASEKTAMLRPRKRPGSPSPGAPDRVPAVSARATPAPRLLPEVWENYFTTGSAPTVGGEDQTRSAVELVATGHLVRAGHTAESGWARIVAAHPDAMTKARGNKRRWVAWVWNVVVREDAAYLAAFPSADAITAAAVTEAHLRLRSLLWSTPRRRRPAVRLVAQELLRRMLRTNTLRVPCPQRDLVLDTGIADRKVIGEALRVLHSGGFGVLHEVFDPGADRARTSHEFSIDRVPVSDGVRIIPPPSLQHPLPAQGGHCTPWVSLPRPCHSLWCALRDLGRPSPLPTLATAAQLTDSPDGEPSVSVLRSTRSALLLLAEAGLASCDEAGNWSATSAWDPGHAATAVEDREALAAQIREERAAYRQGWNTNWATARAAAVKKQRAKEVAWWGSLTPQERSVRQDQHRRQFASLSPVEQAQKKAEWASRRAIAGEDEVSRHRTWCQAHLTSDRAAARSHWFGNLPRPERAARRAAWEQHRRQFGLPENTPARASLWEDRLFDTRAARDDQFLVAQQAQQPRLVDVGDRTRAG